MKRFIQIGIFGILVWSLVSGCAERETGISGMSSTLPTNSQADAEALDDADHKQGFQNRKEKQLVALFLVLLQMDKKEGLAVTSDQAQKLLPYVHKSKDAGQLTEQEQQGIIALMTHEQLAFYDDFTSGMLMRKRGGPPLFPDELTPEEREKLAEEFRSRRQDMPPREGAASGPPREGEPPLWGPGMGTSIEQQLIQLLESKLISQ